MDIQLQSCDRIWINTELISFSDIVSAPYGVQRLQAIGVKDGKIVAIVPMSMYENIDTQAEIIDVDGRWVSPGFIDCHTHLVYAGSRNEEFELRQRGVPYTDILQQGGGIYSTVRATRRASERELLDLAIPRVKKLISEGVTRVEIKSGYGLDLQTEIKLLKVAKVLEKALPISVSTSFMAAHITPVEYKGRTDDYVDLICNEMLPEIKALGLADAVDVFCDKQGFSLEQCKLIFRTARAKKLPVKIHAEQLSNSKGAAMACTFNALSADHLVYLDEEGAMALASYGTIAVLLPGTWYFLDQQRKPPVDRMRELGVEFAVASDYNPGSAPILSLQLMLTMACISFGLTPEEALKGVTKNAAKALGVDETEGSLQVGKVANMLVWDVESPGDICSQHGHPYLYQRIFKGKITRFR